MKALSSACPDVNLPALVALIDKAEGRSCPEAVRALQFVLRHVYEEHGAKAVKALVLELGEFAGYAKASTFIFLTVPNPSRVVQ